MDSISPQQSNKELLSLSLREGMLLCRVKVVLAKQLSFAYLHYLLLISP